MPHLILHHRFNRETEIPWVDIQGFRFSDNPAVDGVAKEGTPLLRLSHTVARVGNRYELGIPLTTRMEYEKGGQRRPITFDELDSHFNKPGKDDYYYNSIHGASANR